MLTLPGDGLKALDDHISDLKSKISETLSHVDIDLENAKLAENVSGKALTVLFRRQTAFDDTLREDFGDGCLLPVVSMLLRICLKASGGIYIDGIDEARDMLASFEREVEGIGPRWFGPRLDLSWPPYFPNTPTDQKAVLDVVAATKQAKLCTREMAIEKLKAEGVIAFSCTTAELIEQIDQEKADAVGTPPPPPSTPDVKETKPDDKEPEPKSDKPDDAKPSVPKASQDAPKLFAWHYQAGLVSANEVRTGIGLDKVAGGDAVTPVPPGAAGTGDGGSE
jgi:hypothetical protein